MYVLRNRALASLNKRSKMYAINGHFWCVYKKVLRASIVHTIINLQLGDV